MSAAGGNSPGGQKEFSDRLQEQFWYYVLNFVEGDENSGSNRLMVSGLLVLLFVVASRLFEPIEALPLLDWLLPPDGPRGLLPPTAAYMLEFGASFFTRQTLRHVLPPVLGAGLAIYLGAKYLRDLLELPSLTLAIKYMAGTVLGRDYPRMTIDEGRAAVGNPETNPMLRVGGPGWADIKLGNAAIFERVTGPSAVRGAGTHFIRRFETLREAFDLRELERSRSDIHTMTKDGIPIVINEMTVRFRIRARETRNESNPYPVMVGAIRRAAYERKVTARGLEQWPDMVTGAVKSTITSWIARHRMDELIPPPPRDAEEADSTPPYRRELHALFNQTKTRQRFASMGAEIIWVSVGHLRPDPDIDPEMQPGGDSAGRDKIHQQLIDTWKSTHAAAAQDEIADARAYARSLSDTARTQAECDLILKLTNGLRDARAGGLPLDDVLTNHLIEYVSGVRMPAGQPQRQAWLTLQKFFEPGEPDGSATLLPAKD